MAVPAFDRGPTSTFEALFAAAPDYAPVRQHFWYDWGPIYYRGRLDGSARVLCIASDPGPTERVAGRTLVGDAGQRVQGLLAKIGLTRSYLCLNAFTHALFPSHLGDAPAILARDDQLTWRNQLYDAAAGSQLQAVIAFGANAQEAVRLWDTHPNVPIFKVPHPSNHSTKVILDSWRVELPKMRLAITPDPDGDPSLPNYGTSFKESDYRRIPPFDLPFGVPPWLGDDHRGRTTTPRHNNSVSRPTPDDRHTLIWRAPTTTGP
jgi:Uracil DNA glycosylase superfamily